MVRVIDGVVFSTRTTAIVAALATDLLTCLLPS